MSGKFTDSCTTQKILPLNTMTKNFASKLLSQGSIGLDNLSKNAKMIRFWDQFQYFLNQLCEIFFFRYYYCSKWCQKHRICNWWVKENKVWMSEPLHFKDKEPSKKLVCLFHKLWRPLPCGRISSQPLPIFPYCVCATRSHHKNKE